MLAKKIILLSMICIYSFSICSFDVFAKPKKSQSKSKKKSNKKTNRKVVKSISAKIHDTEAEAEVNNTEATEKEVKETKTVATTNTYVKMTNASSDSEATENASETTSETAKTEEAEEKTEEVNEEQLINGIPADESWDEFKFCMQQQCMGSPEQPNNVECYKTINYDNAFQSCKIVIKDTSKYDLYEKYFTTVYLVNEQEEACRQIYAGTWIKDKQACEIAITYTRKYKSNAKVLKNERVGCNDKKVKKWYISTKKAQRITCSYESFGLDACYADSADQTANEIALWTGIGTTAIGLAAGVASGISAGVSATKKETVTKKDSKGNETTDSIEVAETNKNKKVWTGVSAGLQAGSGMALQGASQIATAAISSQNVGNQVRGRCSLPDGTAYQEDSVIELSY